MFPTRRNLTSTDNGDARHASLLNFDALSHAAKPPARTASKSNICLPQLPRTATDQSNNLFLQHDKTLAELRTVQEVARNRLQAQTHKPAVFESLRCMLTKKNDRSPTQVFSKEVSEGSEEDYSDAPCIRDFLALPAVNETLRPQERMLLETYNDMEKYEQEQLTRRDQAMPPSRAFLLAEAFKLEARRLNPCPKTVGGDASLSSVLPSEVSKMGMSQMSLTSQSSLESRSSSHETRIQNLKTRVLCLTMQGETAFGGEKKAGSMCASKPNFTNNLSKWIRRPTFVASGMKSDLNLKALKQELTASHTGEKISAGMDVQAKAQFKSGSLQSNDKACALARSCLGKRVRRRCARTTAIDAEKPSDHVYVFVSSQFD